MANIKKDYNTMSLPMNITRGNPIPVDSTEIWYSLEEAQEYALNGATSYVGQSIKVIDESAGTITNYTISIDGSLIEDGRALQGELEEVKESVSSHTDKITVIEEYLKVIPSDAVTHGESKELLFNIIETYILNIAESLLAFDVTKIVVGKSDSDDDESGDSDVTVSTSAKLGEAILGQMVLG